VASAETGALGGEGFSIGEAAAIVGVSTHVIRSWERRLSLELNHRTRSNQRRYWMEDVRRFVAIKRLHESSGLPLVESAAQAQKLAEDHPKAESLGNQATKIDTFWAGLVDVLPDILLVIDHSGRIVASNKVARAKLNIMHGRSFIRLAPKEWRRTYRALHLTTRGHPHSIVLAMRGRNGTVFMDARVVPLGHSPRGSAVLIGSRLRGQAMSDKPPDMGGSVTWRR
jgi:DNA-binding transcriptional MerR regulator